MCSIPNCDLENENGEDKCILHCSKEKIKHNPEVIKKFWNRVREDLISEKVIDLKGLNFPSFEKIELNNEEKVIEDCNFLRKGESKIVEKYIDFSNSFFHSNIDFKELEFTNCLSFNNCKMDKFLKFENIHCSDISFFKVHFIEFVLFDIKCSKISFNESIFEKRTKIEKINITEYLDFSEVILNDLSHVKLIKLQANDFKISNIFNDAKNVSLLDIEIKNNFCLHFSDLNNFIFNNVDLKCATLNFKEISVKNTIFSSVKWGILVDKKLEVENRNIFREIKYSLESQGDIIEANKFYALEMKERDKELKWKENFLDKLVFKAHGIFSNHSQDWILPIIWIFLIGMFASFIDIQLFNAEKINDTVNPFYIFVFSIFFGVYHLISVYKDWSYYYYTYVGSLLGIGYIYLTNDYLFTNFSKTVNPFSIMKSSEDLNIIQLLFKIIIAYLIYQLVVSIRQNTRRK